MPSQTTGKIFVNMLQIMTDTSFGAAADLQAKEHSPYAPTYFYVYDYMSEDTLPDYVGE